MRKWAHRLQSVALSPGCNKRRGSLQVLKVVGATGILGNDVINFKAGLCTFEPRRWAYL